LLRMGVSWHRPSGSNEPFVSPCTFHVLGSSGVPANANIPARLIEIGNIRFDVQKRCSVNHIDIFHIERSINHINQANQRKANGVGPSRGTRREYPMEGIIKEGFYGHAISTGEMQEVEQVNMRKFLQVKESFLESRIHFDGSRNPACPRGLNRCPFKGFMGCTDDSYRV